MFGLRLNDLMVLCVPDLSALSFKELLLLFSDLCLDIEAFASVVSP
jgi:hypothetical protein